MIPPLLRPAAYLGVLLWSTPVRAQSPSADGVPTLSASGQFILSGGTEYSPLLRQPALATNASLIRLEPALLAVSAERFKISLWDQIGLKPDTPWRGKIYLSIRPARSTEDGVRITSWPLLQSWNYRVDLPDVLTRTRCTRALAAVLLLEIANRGNPVSGRSAEIPAWLTAGLAQQVLAVGGAKLLLSLPSKQINGLPMTRMDETERGLDLLAGPRRALRHTAALTFEQLSWPDDAQLDGADGGIYLASAQLFVHELLELENGASQLRALLAQLPGCLNWQTAFFSAFHSNFQRPLDVEKWWALRVIDFAANDSGPRWTPAASCEQLDRLVSVPVEVRGDSNSLPDYAEIPLSAALRNFDEAQRDAVLTTVMRDLELARIRLAPPFAELADRYGSVLADFLGGEKKAAALSIGGKTPAILRSRASLEDTIKQINALDLRRQQLESQLKAGVRPSR